MWSGCLLGIQQSHRRDPRDSWPLLVSIFKPVPMCPSSKNRSHEVSDLLFWNLYWEILEIFSHERTQVSSHVFSGFIWIIDAPLRSLHVFSMFPHSPWDNFQKFSPILIRFCDFVYTLSPWCLVWCKQGAEWRRKSRSRSRDSIFPCETPKTADTFALTCVDLHLEYVQICEFILENKQICWRFFR